MTTIARYNWIDENNPQVEHKNDIKWDYSTGGIAMCSGNEAYAQTIEAVILTIRGELVTQRNAGIPYFSTVFSSQNLAPEWANAVKEAVLALDFVFSIDNFEYEFDEKTKTMHYQMGITTTDGASVIAEG